MTALDDTRRALHAVAEQLLAGPQYRASGTIRLRVQGNGFATVAAPDVRVEDGEVIAGDRRVLIDGATAATLGASIGLVAGVAEGVYPDGAGVGVDDVLSVDAVALGRLTEAFRIGDAALREFAPEIEPVLWPEHFDLGIRVDDVNYGLSPGDSYLGEPYVYVGVTPVPDGALWNAPFGAVRPLAELTGAAAVVEFFTEGQRG